VGQSSRTTREVVVLTGGPSAEREVSLSTGRECAAALRDAGDKVIEVYVDTEFGIQLACEGLNSSRLLTETLSNSVISDLYSPEHEMARTKTVDRTLTAINVITQVAGWGNNEGRCAKDGSHHVACTSLPDKIEADSVDHALLRIHHIPVYRHVWRATFRSDESQKPDDGSLPPTEISPGMISKPSLSGQAVSLDSSLHAFSKWTSQDMSCNRC
jgi:hypothetical protein